MHVTNWVEILFFFVLVAISTPLLGTYMYRVYTGKPVFGDRVWKPVERAFYRVMRIDPESEQRWSAYVISLLVFTVITMLFTYAIMRLQGHLPGNPNHLKGLKPQLAWNSAVSFGSNSDWQNYVGESTMSLLSQTVGIFLHFVLSAAVGMALAAGFLRGLTRRRSTTIGNFWVDTVRSTLGILIPVALVFSFIFMSQGVIQNYHANTQAKTVATQAVDKNGKPVTTQALPTGPVASWVPLEALGDNGGAFFNANAAHPFEDPNPVTNILILWLLAMIPFAFPWTFGKMIGSMREGAVVLTAMLVLFLIGLFIVTPLETRGNPKLKPSGVTQTASAKNPGGNLEGKEVRIGASGSALDANFITGTSAGMTDSAHESYTPVGGTVPLFQIMLGEVDPGGVGTGLYGMLILVFVTVFLAGLMVGRTPEYLGKKVQAREVKLVAIYILVLPFAAIILAGIAISVPAANKWMSTGGPHGLTEVVYAFVSMAHNNGSAFGGLTGNNTFWNATGGMSMLIGRYFLIIPAMAIAGSLARKKSVPASAGTLRTDTPLFTGMLIVTTVIVTGLTYFPVIALGPLAEHFTGHF
jgi:K+-transporting ATPase ATPase A chain